jgi:hypothetical protein
MNGGTLCVIREPYIEYIYVAWFFMDYKSSRETAIVSFNFSTRHAHCTIKSTNHYCLSYKHVFASQLGACRSTW